jgi:signal transduction histidine kinase
VLIELIENNRDVLIEKILEHLTTRYPGRSREELLDTLPLFLDEIVVALRVDRGEQVPGGRQETLGESRATKHGLVRKQQGFNFDRIVHDYGIICDVVTGLAIDKRVECTMRELQILNRCIDEATALACEGYLRDNGAHKANSITDSAAEIHSALAGASLAFALIRKGKVAVDGATANVVERNLANVADRMARILSQSQTGALVARRDRVRVEDLVETVRGEVATERGVEIQTTFPPDLDFEGDAYLLTLALGHMLRAAIACSQRDGKVTLRVRRVEGALSLEVEDACEDQPDRRLGPSTVALGLAGHAAHAHGGRVVTRKQQTGWIVAIEMPRTTRIVPDHKISSPEPIP